jgi:hypothetical protein
LGLAASPNWFGHQKEKMKLLQSILIILLFSSCSTIGKKNILYGKCGKGYFACTQFELKDDKTFEYYIFMDVGGGNVIKGNWDYLNGDTLKLNTFIQPKIPKTYYEGQKNNELAGRVKVEIRDHEIPLGFAYVEINNGEVKGNLNEEGIGYFEISEIRNITYSFLGDRQETIRINNTELNDIEIFVRDLESGVIPEYFVDKLVVVTAKEINMYPNSPERNYKLKRSRFGKKYWK